MQDLLSTRIYPLATADDPPATEFLNFSQAAFNGVHANDFSFFEEVASIVADEPAEALDPERAGQLAAVGIVAGQPFAPDERMRLILDQAARIGAAIVRSLVFAPRDPGVYYYPGSSWATAFVGGSHEFLGNGARLLDARAMMHYVGTGITPAMTHAGVGMLFEPNGDLIINFGPTAPAGRDGNWLQTRPAKGWFPILRIYGPLQSWFDKTWRPGELQPAG